MAGLLAGTALVSPVRAAPSGPAAAVLPAGGVVQAGTATIGAPTGGSLTVSQASSKAIVDWTGFSIGAGASVRFDNGSGATLNRVTGSGLSSIDGLLSASGSVYLLNPNGVIVSKTGVVKVGGRFVASTLGLTDDAFLKGGDLTFSGPSTASVVNLGKVGALGGDVALIASRVENQGSITAPQGSVGLLAGARVLVRDAALDGGQFSVLVGSSGDASTNAGAIAAAAVELRANGGNVYALAGDTGGAISATGTATRGGKVFLVAQGGATTVRGGVTAKNVDGAGGSVETSGQTVDFGGANVTTGQGGVWLLDPNELDIDQNAASAIQVSLGAGTNVVQQTTAAESGGSGFINVDPNVVISWRTAASLTFSAYTSIALSSGVLLKSTGGGSISLIADNTGTGAGTVGLNGAQISTAGAVTILYNPASNPAGSGINPTSYTNPSDFSAGVTGGGALTAAMLVNTLNDLQNVRNNLSGSYAQARAVDASASSGWNSGAGFSPIGAAAAPFTGSFNGRSLPITGLTISRAGADDVGLFGVTSNAKLSGFALVGGNVAGRGRVGALVGTQNGGSISASGAAATVTGSADDVGGLVGDDVGGAITGSYANNSVTATAADNVGGLVGLVSSGTVTQSYSDAQVTGNSRVGGLVGDVIGTTAAPAAVTDSYANGGVSGSSLGGLVGQLDGGSIATSYSSGPIRTVGGGGLIGVNNGGTVANAFWDTDTSGVAASAGGTGLHTSDFGTASNFTGFTFGTTPGGAGWVIVVDAEPDPYFYSKGAVNLTRPMLLSEYRTHITNLHQLQLVILDFNASYQLDGNLDASGVFAKGSPWISPAGLEIRSIVPSQPGSSAFDNFGGVFDGQGHTISNLTIKSNNQASLFYDIGGMVKNLGLTNVNLDGDTAAGVAFSGNMSNVYVTGSIHGAHGAGGLVLDGTSSAITTSYSEAAISGDSNVGGIIGRGPSTTVKAHYDIDKITINGAHVLTFGGMYDAQYNDWKSSGMSLDITRYLGNPDTNGFYSIGSIADLRNVQGFLDQGGLKLKLTTDIDLSSAPNLYLPYLMGTLDGQGHSISNVSLDLPRDQFGFINVLDHGTATNVKLLNGSVNGGFQVGGLVGYANAGTILNSVSAVDVSALAAAGGYGDGTGGLVGFATASTVSGSSASGKVTAKVGGAVDFTNGHFALATGGLVGGAVNSVITGSFASGAVTGDLDVGGLVGHFQAGGSGFATQDVGSIVNSYATGVVTGGGDVGGLVGFGTGKISGSYATGAATATAGLAGGLVAYSSFSIDSSHATGKVTGGCGDVGCGAGGLVGRNVLNNLNGVDPLTLGGISNSYASGDVIGTGYTGGLVGDNVEGALANVRASGNVSGGAGTGGLVGVNEGPDPDPQSNYHAIMGTITGGSATGDVTGVGNDVGGLIGASFGTVSSSTASGSVTGMDHTGGLIGFNNAAVSGSTASGAVSGAGYTGGLVGLNYAAVTGSHATGAVGGSQYVGGLVGWNTSYGSIDGSDAAGAVTDTGDYAGGLVGVNVGAVTNSRALAGATAKGVTLAGGLVGLNQGSIASSAALNGVMGDRDLGGLVGWNDTAGTISKSYAAGAVMGRAGGGDAVTHDDYVGGLIGVNFGAASDVYATGAVSGVQVVGGLVGTNMPGGAGITNAYSTGAVSATRGAVGGLAGVQAGTLTSVYFQPSLSGQSSGAGYTTPTATGAPTAIGAGTVYDASAPATYQGFDFTSTWQAKPNGAPTLQGISP